MTPLYNYVVCFSHLRWDFVYQRPQHLMSRASQDAFVIYVEEPVFEQGCIPRLDMVQKTDNLRIAVPHLPFGLDENQTDYQLYLMIKSMLSQVVMEQCLFWYYTPMALSFTRHLTPGYVVYDCMDELSAFKFAPSQITELEHELFERANIVFTGGKSLFNAKQKSHERIYLFPSSIDKSHFAKARLAITEPEDQALITGFKIGFYGVIDERFDVGLIAEIADQRPEWQIVLIGPVVKIDPAILPRNSNIHYLGPKTYEQLPLYLSGWDVALIPFLLNESTVYISPTKTPEYLAAGKPVVSTAIKDVIDGYAVNGLVSIGNNASEFIGLIQGYRADKPGQQWLQNVDRLLMNDSWDSTFKQMLMLIMESKSNLESLKLPVSIQDEQVH